MEKSTRILIFWVLLTVVSTYSQVLADDHSADDSGNDLSVAEVSAASTAYVFVNGLVCDFCARALEKVFGREEAVKSIDVNLDSKIITVNFNEGKSLSDKRLKQLITDAGYNVESIRRAE